MVLSSAAPRESAVRNQPVADRRHAEFQRFRQPFPVAPFAAAESAGQTETAPAHSPPIAPRRLAALPGESPRPAAMRLALEQDSSSQ
jgi:hypothetical protein